MIFKFEILLNLSFDGVLKPPSFDGGGGDLPHPIE